MRSDTVKKGYEKAPHRALLRATGLKDEDFSKPFVAIVNSYVDIVPGHVHLQDFGKMVKEAVRAAGEGNVSLEKMSLEAYQAISPVFESDVYQVFDPMKSIEKRNAIGGTSLQSVKNQIQKIKGV